MKTSDYMLRFLDIHTIDMVREYSIEYSEKLIEILKVS